MFGKIRLYCRGKKRLSKDGQFTHLLFDEERPRGQGGPPGTPQPRHIKKLTEPKPAGARTLGHFLERAGETLEHKLRLGLGPTPKSLFVSEIQTFEVSRRSKFTL